MKKAILPIVLLFFYCNSAFSQLSPGSLSPDFTGTDINGNEHNLYSLLAEGKTVVIDIFTTWCSPCWDYHQTHILADLFEQYGPNGTNEIFVLAIEGDDNTNVDCLYGNSTCNNTLGDWTENTPYPIINNKEIASLFKISYYPTLFMIFPNRRVFEIPESNYEPLQSILSFRVNGPEIQEGIHPAFYFFDIIEGPVCPENAFVSNKYAVYNQGTETITSTDITLYINGNVAEEFHWEGNAEPWEPIGEFEFTSIPIGENSTVEFKMENINGSEFNSFSHFSEILTRVSNNINLTITTDAAAESDQNFFLIKNESGSILDYQVLNYPNHTYEFQYELGDVGCYTFEIHDAGGNGISGNGSNSNILMTDDQGHVIFDQRNFGFTGVSNFYIPVLSDIDNLLHFEAISISPNPVNSLLELELDLVKKEDLNLTIFNINGKEVYTDKLTNLQPGSNKILINVYGLRPGVYLLKIKNKDVDYTQKFIRS